MTITRKELYQAIWITPASRLAKTYGVSDNGLRKICRRVRVPVPDNTYWWRKKLGYKTWRPAMRRDVLTRFREMIGAAPDPANTPRARALASLAAKRGNPGLVKTLAATAKS